MEFSYYPGCSLEATAIEFHESVTAVFEALKVGLHELEDWNCCGASSAHSLNKDLSLALPTRNLAIAQELDSDLVMPCAACFNRHIVADYELRADTQIRQKLEQAVGFSFTGKVHVRPLLEVIGSQIGLSELKQRVIRPLTNLKVVGYYGCLLVRPPQVTQFENPDNPTLMNDILETLGAEACAWSYATECCGGGLSLTKPKIAARLVSRLVDTAKEAGAEAMVTSCPLCQINLEMRQSSELPKMPIFYFTELIGLAFGIEQAASWFGKHLIDPRPLLSSLQLL